MKRIYEPLQLLIADDHSIFRDGLRNLLSNFDFIEKIYEADNGRDAVALSKEHKIDVVFMDIKMPLLNGIEATKQIVKEQPDINVIALSMFDDDELIIEMLDAGAKGYLLKNANKDEIEEALVSVYYGNHFYCSAINQKIRDLLYKQKQGASNSQAPVFTDKEIEIIELICQENTAKEIAEKMFLSFRTVEGYKKRIQEKLNVKNSIGIALYALKHKIIHH